MDSCYANVVGGIGNQLFIVAAAYSYAKKHNKKFFINPSNWSGSQGNHSNSYKDNVFKNFQYGLPTNPTSLIVEQQFNYSEPPYYDGDVSFDGYFQSLKYFEKNKDEFINMLNFPKVKTSFIDKTSIAFHIRRGDYLQLKHIFDVCDTKYFNDLFVKYAGYDIYVFTDSPDIVLQEFGGHDFKIILTNNEIEDLTIMSNFPNMVCSNSSFSWWASLLGVKKDIILVPDEWLIGQNCSDIYRNDMTINKDESI